LQIALVPSVTARGEGDGLSPDLSAWLAGQKEIAIGTVLYDDLIRQHARPVRHQAGALDVKKEPCAFTSTRMR